MLKVMRWVTTMVLAVLLNVVVGTGSALGAAVIFDQAMELRWLNDGPRSARVAEVLAILISVVIPAVGLGLVLQVDMFFTRAGEIATVLGAFTPTVILVVMVGAGSRGYGPGVGRWTRIAVQLAKYVSLAELQLKDARARNWSQMLVLLPRWLVRCPTARVCLSLWAKR